MACQGSLLFETGQESVECAVDLALAGVEKTGTSWIVQKFPRRPFELNLHNLVETIQRVYVLVLAVETRMPEFFLCAQCARRRIIIRRPLTRNNG